MLEVVTHELCFVSYKTSLVHSTIHIFACQFHPALLHWIVAYYLSLMLLLLQSSHQVCQLIGKDVFTSSSDES